MVLNLDVLLYFPIYVLHIIAKRIIFLNGVKNIRKAILLGKCTNEKSFTIIIIIGSNLLKRNTRLNTYRKFILSTTY